MQSKAEKELKWRNNTWTQLHATMNQTRNTVKGIANTLLTTLQSENSNTRNITYNTVTYLQSELQAIKQTITKSANVNLKTVSEQLNNTMLKIQASILNNTTYSKNFNDDVVKSLKTQINLLLGG